MRIRVYEPGGSDIKIILPNWLIFNWVAAIAGAAVVNKTAGDELKLSSMQLYRLLREIRRAERKLKRRFGKIELVRVESSGGELVQIIL